ncbi:hypothetical protein P691DRAFT_615329, partial [Macrolepiota fuliginosa MF-IS2]
VTTVIDSGVTDHCFVQCKDFTSYTPYHTILSGQAAGKENSFTIAGKGSVGLLMKSGGQLVSLTLNNILHTPDLCSNL